MKVVEKKSNLRQVLKKYTPNVVRNGITHLLNICNPSRKYPPLYHFCKKHYNSTFWWADVTFCGDGLLTMHNCDFIKDPLFKESYALGKATGSWEVPQGSADPIWRAYIVCWIANHVKNLTGDFVECGVNKGGYARSIINYINFKTLSKTFYLLDTFEGFDDRYITAEEKKNKTVKYSFYSSCYQEVVEIFKEFPNVSLIKGTVPETLELIKSEKIAYVSIDMNCVIPSIEAIKFLWPKMVTGGMVILDDYGWPLHFLQKKAFDEWALENFTSILSLPTGQGILIKQ